MANITIAAMTAKATPVAGDLIEIADSAAANAAKKVTAGTLPVSTAQQAALDAHAALTVTHGASGAVVGTTSTQTLTNKTLTTPTIGSFANAGHSHADAAGGGTLAATAIGSGTVATARLGSGAANSGSYLRGDQTWAAVSGGASVDGQTPAYAATVTPALTAAFTVVKVGALTGNIIIGAPTGSPALGWRLIFMLDEDATGGRTVTWNAAFLTPPPIDTTASAKNTIEFIWDGSDWR